MSILLFFISSAYAIYGKCDETTSRVNVMRKLKLKHRKYQKPKTKNKHWCGNSFYFSRWNDEKNAKNGRVSYLIIYLCHRLGHHIAGHPLWSGHSVTANGLCAKSGIWNAKWCTDIHVNAILWKSCIIRNWNTLHCLWMNELRWMSIVWDESKW